jgi:hypothetical protein
LTPVVRRTWAPRGRTPVLRHRFRRWQRISMAGLCCYGPGGSRARLAFHAQPGAYTSLALIGVIGQLRRFLHGAKVTLLWDNLPAHRSRQMRQFLATQRGWLVVEQCSLELSTSSRQPCGKPIEAEQAQQHGIG